MGINIDEINWTEIIISAICSTYPFVWWQTPPNICPVALARNLTRITKNMCFSKGGHWSVFYKRHAQGLFITLEQTGCCTSSTCSLEYQSISNREKKLALNYQLDPQIALPLSALIQYEKCCLYCPVSDFLC